MQNTVNLTSVFFSLSILLASCATTNQKIDTSIKNNGEIDREVVKTSANDEMATLVIGVSARNIVTTKAPYDQNKYALYLAKYSPKANKFMRDEKDIISYSVDKWPPENVIKDYYYHIVKVRPGDYALLSAKVGNSELKSLAWESSTFSVKSGETIYVGNLALGNIIEEQKIRYRYVASDGTISDAELALARYLGVKEKVKYEAMAPTAINCESKDGAMKVNQALIHGVDQACFVTQ